MKTDLTISRAMTINSGNYQSIRPSVTLTLKDVDVTKVREAFPMMKEVVDVLFDTEVVDLRMRLGEITGDLRGYTQKVIDTLETNLGKLEVTLTGIDDLGK